MKKVFLIALFAIVTTISGWSQEMSPNAIGLKFGAGVGDYIGAGVTISYQKALNEINRVEFNLGISSGSGYNHISAGAFYQWVRNIEGGLNWYIGPGASIANVNVKHGDNLFFMGVAGQVGLEYRFTFPLQLTLDVNPYIGILNSEGFAMPIQLGVRYMF